MAKYLGYEFVDAANVIRFDKDGSFDSETTRYLRDIHPALRGLLHYFRGEAPGDKAEFTDHQAVGEKAGGENRRAGSDGHRHRGGRLVLDGQGNACPAEPVKQNNGAGIATIPAPKCNPKNHS